MKRAILAVLVLVLLPTVATFAEFGIGGAAFYNSPYLMGQEVDKKDLNVNQFTFGADARLKLSVLQAEALALYANGDGVQSLNIYTDFGLAIDILLLRLSAGIGPNFVFNIDEKDKAVQTGLNGKLSADVKLGHISAGLSYIMDLNLDDGIDLNTSSGLLGAQVILWL
jgi:hypothetical protein